MTSNDSDEALVAQAQADPAAFGPLYERHVRAVYNYVFYRLGNVHEAEDVTAKVFYQALTHLHGYASRGVPFSAWLFRIAHNLVANWYRDTRRRRTFSLDDACLERPDGQKELDQQAVDREGEQELRRILGGLSPERQQLVVLKYVQGMSNAEIGTIMGRSEGAVKALLHRTLLSLRAEIVRNRQSDRDSSSLTRLSTAS